MFCAAAESKKWTMTYVTSCMKLNQTAEKRNTQWRFEKFAEIAESGIPICVYTDGDGIEWLKKYQEIFRNIEIMEISNLQDRMSYKTWVSVQNDFNVKIELPEYRTVEKDTCEYLLLMNSKIEFVKDAMVKNPFNTTHFAWIDFNISHVFKNIKECNQWLKFYSLVDWTHQSPFLCMPGCCEKIETEQSILSQINWRFCGGFFLGDRASLEYFYKLYYDNFANFLMTQRKLVWEVNFWAWLELIDDDWCPSWYQGDHNDSIIQIPAKYYSFCLNSLNPEIIKYDYPIIDAPNTPDTPIFSPGSASVVEKNGQIWMNTRYVNYQINAEGYYIFKDAERKIITRNICSILDENTMKPRFYVEMKEPDNLESVDGSIIGLEDVRIFTTMNLSSSDVNFIATSVNYSKNGTNQMIMGKYNVVKSSNSGYLGNMEDCFAISSPFENEWICEKNWIPLEDGKIIYKWSPFEVGIVKENKLSLVSSDYMKSPLCKKFRGSSIFVSSQNISLNERIGVVHFSENEYPRHYFHCLVVLAKRGKTWKPRKHSQTFYFKNIGVEFCIGFLPKNGKYHFWISQFDREPLLMIVDMDKIPFFDC